jgi:hypothetical protein
MSLGLAELIRIAATATGTAFGGPAGGALANLGVGALTGLADELDHEDTEPEARRKMKEKRREDWIKFCVKLEREKRELYERVQKKHGAIPEALKIATNNRAAAELRAVITGSIYETEGRIPEGQEVNLMAEFVSAIARQKA